MEGTERHENNWLNFAWECCMKGGILEECSVKRRKVQFICSETSIAEHIVEYTQYGKCPGKEVSGQEVHRNSVRGGTVVQYPSSSLLQILGN